MIHGSTSFNFCWSNAEHCCDLLNTHWTFVEQQLHILARIWNGGRGNVAVALRSSVVAVIMRRRQKRRKNRKIWTREWLRNRTIIGAYYTLLAELRNLDISSYRLLWYFDLISHRHGKVSYRLISWLVLSKLHSNSADSNSSAAMLIFPRRHVTPNSKTVVEAVQQAVTCWTE